METKTLGRMIAELRKAQGMTQLELADKMGVTDKAVSKWERDLSCPDIGSFSHLAEILHVSVDELLQIKTAPDRKVTVRRCLFINKVKISRKKTVNKIRLQGGHVPPCKHLVGARAPTQGRRDGARERAPS